MWFTEQQFILLKDDLPLSSVRLCNGKARLRGPASRTFLKWLHNAGYCLDGEAEVAEICDSHDNTRCMGWFCGSFFDETSDATSKSQTQ